MAFYTFSKLPAPKNTVNSVKVVDEDTKPAAPEENTTEILDRTVSLKVHDFLISFVY